MSKLFALLVCFLVVGCTEPFSRSLCSAKIDEQDYEGAIEACDTVIQLGGPDLSTAYSERGYAYERLNEPLLALADYGKAIEEDPKNFYPYANRCTLLGDFGKYEEAAADCDKAVQFAHMPAEELAWAYSNRAFNRFKRGDKQGALEDVQKAMELNPDEENFAAGYEVLNKADSPNDIPNNKELSSDGFI
jgi:tetratricopeptide (TPR) repeat protein